MRKCTFCAERLKAENQVDSALAVGLRRYEGGSSCPDPESLAAWIDGGRVPDRAMDQHLSECFPCRGLLLDSPGSLIRAPKLRRHRRSGLQRSPSTSLVWAATFAVAGLLWVFVVGYDSGPAERTLDGRARRPFPVASGQPEPAGQKPPTTELPRQPDQRSEGPQRSDSASRNPAPNSRKVDPVPLKPEADPHKPQGERSKPKADPSNSSWDSSGPARPDPDRFRPRRPAPAQPEASEA